MYLLILLKREDPWFNKKKKKITWRPTLGKQVQTVHESENDE